MSAREAAPPSAESLAQLAAGQWRDPHRLLGFHRRPELGWILAFQPGAEAVSVVLPRAEIKASQHPEEPGFFMARLTSAQADEVEGALSSGEVAYRLRVVLPDASELERLDPYCLSPTLGPTDLHLLGEGNDHRLYRHLGAHPRRHQGVDGTAFAVWAPNAEGVRVVGDFNGWDSPALPMRNLDESGIWELFVPGVGPGSLYKFWLRHRDAGWAYKSDPVAQSMEQPPRTASRVTLSSFSWSDQAWMAAREGVDPLSQPVSMYEVHAGSWRHRGEAPGQPLSYRELGDQLGHYAAEMGFTHVELMPLGEHPFGGSWGYQVSGYYAPTARYGSPDDLRQMIDTLHRQGVGVILDWVPGHFPRDDFALSRFDGTALYEHLDPRLGLHPDWGTAIFNYGRREVRNFLVANALYWLDEFHVDGLRVDAVASMLYLDYSRKEGEWLPNRYGGRENLDAIDFIRELNTLVYEAHPGALMIAEESTSWPGVSHPTYTGGLGFGMKWNMGWMHDTLDYFGHDPVHRRFHHNTLTFSMVYAWSENFLLPLSHDEVVHGKGSLLARMPGDDWRKFANLRALYGYQWAHPGKQLLFMGSEWGQRAEWDADQSLDWFLLEQPLHRGMQQLVRDLNRVYRNEPALFERDFDPAGFRWIDASNADANVIAFVRYSAARDRHLICVCNLSPVPRFGYRLGLPSGGAYREVLNSDSQFYGGSNQGSLGLIESEANPWHGLPCSAAITLPPLATVWLVPQAQAG
ncbi:MAG TPA: 1,4-alpha-glucan branching protein GlgB [Candidatus Nanopelagicaceae bacterium]|nr:1,4-alpha-glucan branching protein GlgB [Candidatus Nanopelagicaceae bacterium]